MPPNNPSKRRSCSPAESAGRTPKRRRDERESVDRDQIGELTNQVGELTKEVGGLREDVRGLRAAGRRDFFRQTAAALGVGSLFHWLGARQQGRNVEVSGSLDHAVRGGGEPFILGKSELDGSDTLG